MSRFRVARVALIGCWVCAIALTACGGSSKTTSAASHASGTIEGVHVGLDKRAAAEVPASFRSKGSLVDAVDATYPPAEFIASDGKTVIGFEVDLARALGTVIGVPIRVIAASNAGLDPGVAGRKYDMSLSANTDTKAREQALDFVTYFNAGTSFFVKAGGPKISNLADLCGHTVAVEVATTEQTDAAGQASTCAKGGKPPLRELVFPDQNAINLALSSGRADVGMIDTPAAGYEVKLTHGRFVLGGSYGYAPYGIELAKHDGLAAPLRDGINALMVDGVYKRILAHWNVSSGAIHGSQINPAGR